MVTTPTHVCFYCIPCLGPFLVGEWSKVLSAPLATRQNGHFIKKVNSDMENGLKRLTLEVGKPAGKLSQWLRWGADMQLHQNHSRCLSKKPKINSQSQCSRALGSNIRTPTGFVKTQITKPYPQSLWFSRCGVGPEKSAFLTWSQVILLLLSQGPRFENH